MENKGNNNNLGKVTTFSERSQKTLFDGPIIKNQYKLNKNHFHLLYMMYMHPKTRFTRNSLYKMKTIPMHLNTVANFLKESENSGFIKKLDKIPGTMVNTLYVFCKYPDTFQDGDIVEDRRANYYQITELGEQIYEINERKQ